MDQIHINGKASFDDFGASFARRVIKPPPKKSIKETVPFSNTTYDFSGIDGEVYWEERTLEYQFEITATTPEELETLKTAFTSWVMTVQNGELHDPFIPGYHFVATYEDMVPEDDEGMDKTTLTVTFKAYPYKVSDLPRVYEVTLAADGSEDVLLTNMSAHPIPLRVYATQPLRVECGNVSASLGAGTTSSQELKLPVGQTLVTLYNDSKTADNLIRLSYYEEVF